MSNLNRHPVKRAAVGVLAGALAFTGGAIAFGVSPANALPEFEFERLAGPDRFATAAEIATDTFQTADTVILASGATRNFPDALTGNYLAGEEQAPILLTQPNSLPKFTSDALTRLGANRVIIVGGTSAVSAAVEAELKRRANTTVEREGGIDRYDTAEKVAKRVGGGANSGNVGESGTDNRRTAILGNGQNFPDILAAGPISYAEQFPITISRPESLPAQTRRVIDELDIERVIIVGGETAVSSNVATQVRGIPGVEVVDRIFGGGSTNTGPTRFGTAVELAEFAYSELGFDEAHVNLARGDDFADALSGGPHGGEDRSPIVLTFPNSLQPDTDRFLRRKACTLTSGHIFGGTSAVSTGVENGAVAAARSCANPPTRPPSPSPTTSPTTPASPSPSATPTATMSPSPSPSPAGPDTPTNTIAVTPDTEDTRTVTQNPASGSDGTTADDRTFQVSGLTSGETFRITLIRCENVRGSGSNATFRSSADPQSTTGFSADTGNPTADITSVNGTAVMDSDANTAGFQSGTATFTASGTTATFTIDGDAANECVLPVVYFDSSTANTTVGGNSTRLETRATQAGQFAAPTSQEQVDTGGRTNFIAGTTAPTLSTTVTQLSDTSATLTFTNVNPGFTVTVFCEVLNDSAGNERAGTEDPIRDQTATDEFGTPGFQVTLDGLSPNTRFECVGTQTSPDGTRSEVSNPVVFQTQFSAPVITAAVLGADTSTAGMSDTRTGQLAPDGRATRGDTFTLTFDQPVSLEQGNTISVTDPDNDTALFRCDVGATSTVTPGPGANFGSIEGGPNDDITEVTCILSSDGRTITVQLQEDADDRNPDGGNNDGLQFPLTITATDINQPAAGGGRGVNLAASDRTIG